MALNMHIASEANGDGLGMHLITELPLMNIPAYCGASKYSVRRSMATPTPPAEEVIANNGLKAGDL